MDEHCLLTHQPVAAHADGTLGVGPLQRGAGAPGGLAVGFLRSPSEPCRPPQSLTGIVPGAGIFTACAATADEAEIPNPAANHSDVLME